MAIELRKSWARDSAIAGEVLAVGNVACIKESDGKAYRAKASDINLRPSVGIVSRAAAQNEIVQLTFLGIFQGYAELVKGQSVYLSETPGQITQAVPVWMQEIGVALTAGQIFFKFGSRATLDYTQELQVKSLMLSGGEGIEGSWRLVVVGDNLSMERMESGIWTPKHLTTA